MTEPAIIQEGLLQVDIRTMTKWPCTPTIGRIRRASALIQNTAGRRIVFVEHPSQGEFRKIVQAKDDADKFETLEWLREFERQAMEELEEAVRDGTMKETPETPAWIAFGATNEDVIGFCIRSRSLGRRETEVGLSITALFRDPEWTGLNPILTALRGLEVHIVENRQEPGRAGLIIACDPGDLDGKWEDGKITGRTNLAIRKVAMWHGALSCSWHPNREG